MKKEITNNQIFESLQRLEKCMGDGFRQAKKERGVLFDFAKKATKERELLAREFVLVHAHFDVIEKEILKLKIDVHELKETTFRIEGNQTYQGTEIARIKRDFDLLIEE